MSLGKVGPQIFLVLKVRHELQCCVFAWCDSAVWTWAGKLSFAGSVKEVSRCYLCILLSSHVETLDGIRT